MILKPSEIYFCQDSISNTFDKGCRHSYTLVGQTLDDLCEGRTTVENIPRISVAKHKGKWFISDNKRLWVFRHLERLGKCKSIPVNETAYIPFKKFSTYNGGASVTVRRNPGGHWHLKPSQTSVTRTERRPHSEFVRVFPTSCSQTVSSFGTVGRFNSASSCRRLSSMSFNAATATVNFPVSKCFLPVQGSAIHRTGWGFDNITPNDTKGENNRLNSENDDACNSNSSSYIDHITQSHKEDSIGSLQSDPESEQIFKSQETAIDKKQTSHQDDQSSGYCIVKVETITCPDQMCIDKQIMTKCWLMNNDICYENIDLKREDQLSSAEDDCGRNPKGAETNLSSQQFFIAELRSDCNMEHPGTQEKPNADIFINHEPDGSEKSMSSGYVFYTLGSDNDNKSSFSVQANIDEGYLKKDRSLNAQHLVRNPQKNVNRIVEAVIEGLENRLENNAPAPAKEFLLQTRSYLTDAIGGIVETYEKQIQSYQAEVEELRYQMAQLQVEKLKTGEGSNKVQNLSTRK